MTRKLIVALAVVTFVLWCASASAQDQPKVNVNTATEAQLTYLPGIGTKTAALIIAQRPYKALSDLDKVKGIGTKKLAAITPYVVFEGQTTATAKIKVPKEGGTK